MLFLTYMSESSDPIVTEFQKQLKVSVVAETKPKPKPARGTKTKGRGAASMCSMREYGQMKRESARRSGSDSGLRGVEDEVFQEGAPLRRFSGFYRFGLELQSEIIKLLQSPICVRVCAEDVHKAADGVGVVVKVHM